MRGSGIKQKYILMQSCGLQALNVIFFEVTARRITVEGGGIFLVDSIPSII